MKHFIVNITMPDEWTARVLLELLADNISDLIEEEGGEIISAALLTDEIGSEDEKE